MSSFGGGIGSFFVIIRFKFRFKVKALFDG